MRKGDLRDKLLGPLQVDIAALHMDIGMNPKGNVVAVLQLDGKSHRHQMGFSLAEVLQHSLGHLLWDKGGVCNLAGKSLLGAGLHVLVGGDGLLVDAKFLISIA